MGHNTCKSMGRVLCVVRRYYGPLLALVNTRTMLIPTPRFWYGSFATLCDAVERFFNEDCSHESISRVGL